MSAQFTASADPDGNQTQKLQRRIKQLWITLAVFGSASILCLCLLGAWIAQQSRAIDSLADDVLFGRFVHYEVESDDYVKPVTNVIQFFRDGYSLQFDKVEYTAEGLTLSGVIGNPNQYRIADLNLNFALRPLPANVRDKWDKGNKDLVVWPDDWDIGRAQTRVGTLDPGSTAKFNVTIPNVRQTSAPTRIAVLFSGERYIYLGGR